MNEYLVAAIALSWGFIAIGCWLGCQLLRQNGRILLRLDELENRLDELELGEDGSSRGDEAHTENSEIRNPKSETDQSFVTSTLRSPATEDGSAVPSRLSNRSLERSRIKRDGLKACTPAPSFRLPRLDGRGDLSLEELRGRRVLLVFSDPHCGPCNALAPRLEKFHRENTRKARSSSAPPSAVLLRRTGRPSPPGKGELLPVVEVVMISRGEPKENRAKVKEHRLTFPVVLQQRWEISRRYAMFATPIAYLIDESGLIARDLAVESSRFWRC